MAVEPQSGNVISHFTSGNTTWTGVSIASGIEQGDLLVAHVINQGDTYSSNTGGYTVVGNVADTGGARSLVLAKEAGASESTFNISWGGTARGSVEHFRVKGHRSFDTWGTPTTAATSSNVNTLSVPAYTTTEDGELVFLFGTSNQNTGSDVPPNFTEYYDVGLSSPTRTISAYYRELLTPGSTGVVVYDMTGTNGGRQAAMLIGIRPESGDLVGAVGF